MTRILAVLWALVAGVSAQGVSEPGEQKLERGVRQLEAWLGSDYSDRSLLENAASGLLEAGEAGFRHLARKMDEAVEGRDQRQAAGLESVATHVCLAFVEREVETEMVYAGQYDPLRHLMPFSGKFFLQLLIDTPDWFPDDHRWQVVAALRDLYPDTPGDSALMEIERIAEDRDFESEALRVAATFALAQWGRRGLVEDRIRRLEALREEGNPDDRLFALQRLADVHYQIRDYKTASNYHREFLRRAREAGFPIAPADYYNAACNFSLTGDLESALEALEACAELQASDAVDSSLKLERRLFDKDPEIRAVRGTPRFERIVEKAFGKDG